MQSSIQVQKHCRRKIQPVQQMEDNFEKLLLKYKSSSARDITGRLLVHPDLLEQVWLVQKRHLSCLTDPDGVSLYRQVGTRVVGDITLPIYRCGRGTASLECFHLHVKEFVPGNAANYRHFQVSTSMATFDA